MRHDAKYWKNWGPTAIILASEIKRWDAFLKSGQLKLN